MDDCTRSIAPLQTHTSHPSHTHAHNHSSLLTHTQSHCPHTTHTPAGGAAQHIGKGPPCWIGRPPPFLPANPFCCVPCCCCCCAPLAAALCALSLRLASRSFNSTSTATCARGINDVQFVDAYEVKRHARQVRNIVLFASAVLCFTSCSTSYSASYTCIATCPHP